MTDPIVAKFILTCSYLLIGCCCARMKEIIDMRKKYVPTTPAGTPCWWLAASTEEKAWRNLLKDASHMPFKAKERFVERGYTVQVYQEVEP